MASGGKARADDGRAKPRPRPFPTEPEPRRSGRKVGRDARTGQFTKKGDGRRSPAKNARKGKG